MDWLDFVASLVRSVAWPVAACVIAWLLRRELRSLFARLQTARHRDTELSFAREVDLLSERVVEREVAEDDGETVERQDSDEENGGNRRRADAAARRVACIRRGKEKADSGTNACHDVGRLPFRGDSCGLGGARAILATEGRQRLRRRTPSTCPFPNSYRVWHEQDSLRKQMKVSSLSCEDLRNKAAHGMVEPTSASAIDYAATVDRLLNRLE